MRFFFRCKYAWGGSESFVKVEEFDIIYDKVIRKL